MEEKDVIYVMRGGRCPLVLRSSGQTGTYRLIGDCFLVGFMWGEALVERDFGAAELVCVE